ncbi:MAG: acetyltransferase-like isoleucine patch superfamily enzyme [Psychroserpens sp.]|jgi:acetyltransferase-like isoleucine patch superfamily enzyme
MNLIKFFVKNPFSKWFMWVLRTFPVAVKNKTVRFGYLASSINSDYGKNISIGDFSEIIESNVGDNSYCGKNCVLLYAKIGRFVSIANDVKIGTGIHPIDLVSTSPIFYSTKGQLPQCFPKNDLVEEYSGVIIGNDVWVGENVVIMAGIKVSDGCILAAGAILTKDTIPYGIYGGVPAKLLKTRFNKDIISNLQKSKWWLRDFKELNSSFMNFHNPSKFS